MTAAAPGSGPPGAAASVDVGPARSDDPAWPRTPDGVRRLFRSRDGAPVGGVAAGLAQHLHVPVLWIRLAFVVTAFSGGAGVVAYAVLWVFVPPVPVGLVVRSAAGPSTRRPDGRQLGGLLVVGLVGVVLATVLSLTNHSGWVIGPLGLAVVGAAFIWREADDARRARWRRTAAGLAGVTYGSGRGAAWRLTGGVALVLGGLAVFALNRLDLTQLRSALLAVALTLVGVAVITVPWWIRLVRDLGSERSARSAERERAEIAAHLHDSVLQTLALIQRQANDPREVVRLARSQERQLRTWLYGPAGYAATGEQRATAVTTFAAALATAAGEVEDTYAVAVAPVVVGDVALDPHLDALVQAAREAMVNAAKHAGVAEISVYAEIENQVASVFVRDRGRGFDPAAVAADRRGLAQSVRGRMERHGGRAAIVSAPGAGTEVQLTMPITAAQEATP